jgi:hypothetical protein
MGADIHFFCEKKTASLNYEGPKDLQYERNSKIEEVIEGKALTERWVSADRWVYQEDNSWIHEEAYWSRNYYLFSILADVRNSGDVEPISYPRGIPKDASTGYLYSVNRWDSDGHSHSYFTLEELLNIDWNQYHKEYLEEFLEVIEQLKSIDKNPQKVRICFFFDN